MRLIPTRTARGTFNVWTKRFGNNPRIRLLLLHGGPGATHEYFEAMESFLFLLCPEGSHFAMWDDQQAYMTGLMRFLKDVDEGRKP